MSGDKSYMDSAKETLGNVQQKASDVAGQAYDTVAGTVSLHPAMHQSRLRPAVSAFSQLWP